MRGADWDLFVGRQRDTAEAEGAFSDYKKFQQLSEQEPEGWVIRGLAYYSVSQ